MAVIERSILATDLALHFRDAPALTSLASKVRQSPEQLYKLLEEDTKHRQLLQAGIMTSSDLAAATKPWEVQFVKYTLTNTTQNFCSNSGLQVFFVKFFKN